jgi:hypothetical protein
VAEEHFAGDFGVDGVGVVEEWRGEEGEAGVEGEPEEEDDEAVVALGDVGWSEGIGCGLHRWGAGGCGLPAC